MYYAGIPRASRSIATLHCRPLFSIGGQRAIFDPPPPSLPSLPSGTLRHGYKSFAESTDRDGQNERPNSRGEIAHFTAWMEKGRRKEEEGRGCLRQRRRSSGRQTLGSGSQTLFADGQARNYKSESELILQMTINYRTDTPKSPSHIHMLVR